MVTPGAPLQRITMTQSDIGAGIDSIVASLAQERTIGRDDLVAPQFLKRALAASRCVCRITLRGEGGGLIGYGTGTLVGPGVLLTNNHVLERSQDAAQSEATLFLFGIRPIACVATCASVDTSLCWIAFTANLDPPVFASTLNICHAHIPVKSLVDFTVSRMCQMNIRRRKTKPNDSVTY